MSMLYRVTSATEKIKISYWYSGFEDIVHRLSFHTGTPKMPCKAHWSENHNNDKSRVKE